MCATKKQSNSSAESPFNDNVDSGPEGEFAHTNFSEDPHSVVLAIVETVASITNRDITAMPPLFDVIDPEALTDLLTSPRERSIEVCFWYEGCQIDVSSRGDVTVRPLHQ
ncbi:HalOD1 output domain-containing protein [Haloprofundus marisrubri]|uniref:HalOD1 output domain-containing protein n=1 Tax=Haloprofundus marisrubri TaxID=1514971 RepID=UPI00138EF91B